MLELKTCRITLKHIPSSHYFGKYYKIRNDPKANKKQLWIPPGFAHGFVVLSDAAEFLYSVTDYWAPEHERYIVWNDTTLNIDWPIAGTPILSEKDARGLRLNEAEVYE